jgi:hypothetical protein
LPAKWPLCCAASSFSILPEGVYHVKPFNLTRIFQIFGKEHFTEPARKQAGSFPAVLSQQVKCTPLLRRR